jgi:hypothetical protein
MGGLLKGVRAGVPTVHLLATSTGSGGVAQKWQKEAVLV